MLAITLVTPNFNYKQFLEDAILSVLNQNYPALEYLILDGGSTDGSVEIIKRHAARLAYWKTGPDGGMYDAINEGFRASTGEIMGWLNSDDMHLPWTLRAVSEIFEAFPEVEWITTKQPGYWDYHGIMVGFGQIDGFSRQAFLDGRYFWPLVGRPHDIDKSMVFQGTLQQESTYWRRSLWEKAGGYLSLDHGIAGDFELWSRFLRYSELYGVAIPLAGFRFQNKQQSAEQERYGIESMKALRDARKFFGWKPDKIRSFSLRFGWRFPERLFARHDYFGKDIVRRNLDSPSAGWRIEHCRFR
jgi:glycosyltransferase involved in cell wall biosynthesis